MLEDDFSLADESGAPIKATSIEPKIGATHLLSSHAREEPKTLGYLDAPTTTTPPTTPDPPTQPLDRPTSPDDARPQHANRRVVREDDQGAAPLVVLPSATSPPPPQQPEASTPALENDEWEVRRIVDKRRAGRGCEYKVRWKDTWLPKSELEHARRLL